MANVLMMIGTNVARYGLVVVLIWIGGMKFTAYEAQGIEPLVANSPLMSWAYSILSVAIFRRLWAQWKSQSDCSSPCGRCCR